MLIIVLKSILALVSIFTGGAIFYKYIKDNKILVFLAGSVSILSAVYLVSEIRRDIDKLVVEKKVEIQEEEKQVERKEEVVVEKKDANEKLEIKINDRTEESNKSKGFSFEDMFKDMKNSATAMNNDSKNSIKEKPKTEILAIKKEASYLGGRELRISKGSYYIKVGTWRDATNIVSKSKKANLNYSLVEVENDKTLIHVLIGPFFNRNQANTQLLKVKENILSGAYITKY